MEVEETEAAEPTVAGDDEAETSARAEEAEVGEEAETEAEPPAAETAEPEADVADADEGAEAAEAVEASAEAEAEGTAEAADAAEAAEAAETAEEAAAEAAETAEEAEAVAAAEEAEAAEAAQPEVHTENGTAEASYSEEASAEFAEVLGGSTIPPEDHEEFIEAFRLISEERGFIEGRHVHRLVQALGQDSGCQESVQQQMEEQGLHTDSELGFSETVALISSVYRTRAQVTDDLCESFRVFDRSGKGFLEYEELERAMFRIGNWALEESARADFEHLVRLADKNQDGRIDYLQFCQLVTMGVGELRRRMADE